MPGDNEQNGSEYAISLANASFDWYRAHAISSRFRYKLTETLQLLIAASIPVVAAISPDSAITPAILGATLAVISGARAIFHWQENYVRFSAAREAIEAERRRYLTRAAPYDHTDTRDRQLAEAVTRIEHEEMQAWIRIVSTQQSQPAEHEPAQ